jgi:hypothetical protein
MLLRFLHILLAFNILTASIGVSVTEHNCSQKGRSFNILGLFQKTCCTAKTACKPNRQACSNDRTQKIKHPPCCQNSNKYAQNTFKNTAQKTLKTPYTAHILPCAVLPCSFNFAQNRYTQVFNQKLTRFWLYKPPPLCRDIPLLIQSFRC